MTAVPKVFKWETHLLLLPRSRACAKAGSSIAARIAMMAITTRSSIRVKGVLKESFFIMTSFFWWDLFSDDIMQYDGKFPFLITVNAVEQQVGDLIQGMTYGRNRKNAVSDGMDIVDPSHQHIFSGDSA